MSGMGRTVDWWSTGIDAAVSADRKPEQPHQLGRRADRMGATVKVSNPVESADDDSQQHEEPANQQAVGIVMTDVFEALP